MQEARRRNGRFGRWTKCVHQSTGLARTFAILVLQTRDDALQRVSRTTIGMWLALSETYRCRGVRGNRGSCDVVVVVAIIVVIVSAFVAQRAVIRRPRWNRKQKNREKERKEECDKRTSRSWMRINDAEGGTVVYVSSRYGELYFRFDRRATEKKMLLSKRQFELRNLT